MNTGADGTESFEDVGHDQDARKLLESFYIGDLVDVPRVIHSFNLISARKRMLLLTIVLLKSINRALS
jgi:cytochrome b involved in lipid metabolism